jgi:hypothetical protein
MSDLIEQIKEAFHSDDAARVRELLKQHAELKALINEPLAAFNAPAIVCARSREMLDVLLEAGADINAKSRWWAGGFGLLHGASPELARYAIERGAVIDIHAASRLGMLDRVKQLVSSDRELVHARGGDGQTPLHFADTVEIAEYLLACGAKMDALDVDHESTPAQHMLRDRAEVARYLVSRGCRTDILMAAALGELELVSKHLEADPANIRMSVSPEYFPMRDSRAGGHIYIWTLGKNKTAHLVARQFGHEQIVSFLLERTPEDLKLALAIELGDEALFRKLLAAQPNLLTNLSEEDRRRIAHVAQDNNTEAVRLMLGAGWPVDARGQHGATPLHWAAFHGNPEMAEAILRYHPPLELTDADFNGTPLGWAIHGSQHGWYCRTGDYPRTVEALLKAGAKAPKEIAGSDAVKEVLRARLSAS